MPGSFADYMKGRKGKNKKSDDTGSDAEADPNADVKAEIDDVARQADEALAKSEGTTEETMRDEPAPGPDEVPAGGDMIDVLSRGLDLSTEAAQMAADAIAQMPEFQGKGPDEVVKMIKGDYDLMKKIFEAIAQTSDAVAAAEMNAPAPVGAEAAGLGDLMAGMM